MFSANLHALPPVDSNVGAMGTFPSATLHDEFANSIGCYEIYQTWSNWALAGHKDDDDVTGYHIPPVIGSHTPLIKSLIGTPNHQLLPYCPTFVADGAGSGESMIHSSMSDQYLGVQVEAPAYQEVSGKKLLCPKMSALDSVNTDFILGSSGTCFGEVDFAGGADTEGGEHFVSHLGASSTAEAPFTEPDSPPPPSPPHIPFPPPPPITPHLSKADLAALYEWPMKAAASELGLSLSSLRTLCTDFNIGRWPYRKLISIANFLENVPMLERNPTKRQRLTDLLDRLRENIIEDPNVPIPKMVLNLRQCQYKRRHLEHVRMGSS
eukprot:gene4541-14714_t